MDRELHKDSLQKYTDLLHGFIVNRAKTIKKRDFSKKINDAMAKTDPAKIEEGKPFRYRKKEEKLAGLEKVLNNKHLRKFDSAEIMQLFSAYRDLGVPDKMIEVFERCGSKDFRESPMVLEMLAVAYRKREPHQKDDFQKSMQICQTLAEQGKASSVSYNNIGKCLEKTLALKKEALVQSVQVFEQGFAKTFDPFLGLQMVRGDLELGNKDKAQEMAKVVYLCALRDGAEESKDFYTVSAALQAACIAGEKEEVIEHLCGRLAVSLEYPYQMDEFERNMQKIEESGLNPGRVKQIQTRLTHWKSLRNKEALEGGIIVLKDEKGNDLPDDRAVGNDKKLEALISHSYSYRGCGSDFRGTSRVGGNMEFGGVLPDQVISRKDLELFTGLVQKSPTELGIEGLDKIKGVDPDLKLCEIDDIEVVMQVIDRFVRQKFTTDNFIGTGLHLEEQTLKKNAYEESVYDATVKAVERACGKVVSGDNAKKEKDSNIDTRTNISAIFALGMGDCRHHAQVKQIMVDMCQRLQMNGQIEKMFRQVQDGKLVDLNGEEAQKFYEVLDTEVRTADVQIRMPVLMEQKEAEGWIKKDENGVEKKVWDKKKGADGTILMADQTYHPKLDDEGRYQVDLTNSMHNLEEHTLCWVLKKDRKGNLTTFGLRDAFYQEKEYQWGQMDIRDLDTIKVSRRGKPLVPAGVVPAEKTDKGIPLQIYQVPTPYNKGKRDVVEAHSIGDDVCLLGLRLEGFSDTEEFLSKIKAHEVMKTIMKNVLLRDSEKETPDMNYSPEKVYAPGPTPKPGQEARDIDKRIDDKKNLPREVEQRLKEKLLKERREKN